MSAEMSIRGALSAESDGNWCSNVPGMQGSWVSTGYRGSSRVLLQSWRHAPPTVQRKHRDEFRVCK